MGKKSPALIRLISLRAHTFCIDVSTEKSPHHRSIGGAGC
jgi:hypothetical protein